MVYKQVFLGEWGGGGGGVSDIMHLKEKIFFCHHNFLKKVHSKLTKNEPENIP